jgi:hypothetical protein
VHGENCNHDHAEEHPHKARNEAKAERKVKAAVKGSLTQERTLRPRTARRRAVRALRKVETLQRKQERAEADKAGLPTPENTKVRWHLDSRR